MNQMWANVGDAALQLLQSPYFYASFFLILILLRRQIQLQRRLFFARFHSLLGEWWQTVFIGLLAGVFVTLAMLAVGASIQLQILPVLWLFTLLLMFFRMRFVCFAYCVGLIAFLKPVLELLPDLQQVPYIDWITVAIIEADLFSLILLVGLLHLVEAVFVRIQGKRAATPMFFMSKRGKLIGGYHFQRYWPVPLLLLTPWIGNEDIWTILTTPELFSALLIFIPFPVIVGFSDQTITQLPQEKAKSLSNGLFLYSFPLLGLAWLVKLYPQISILAGVFMVIAHESLRWYARWKESQLMPVFANSNIGLKILAVLPGSPAEVIGILPGETIHKVNGVQVRSRLQMYDAMKKNSAYIKLEVVNLDGQMKFLNRAVFAGEHHQLGIILAPDDDVNFYAESKEYSIFTYLRFRLSGVMKKRP